MIANFRQPIEAAVLTGFGQAETGQQLVLRVTTIHGPLAVTFAISTLDGKGKVRATQLVVDDTAIYAAATTQAAADLLRRTTIAAKRVANTILRATDATTIVSGAGATPLLSTTTEVQ